jgi:hypothetical protein
MVLLPFRRKARCGFFRPEKSDGFGRVCTRELGYQKVQGISFVAGLSAAERAA